MANIVRTVIQIRRAHTEDWLANKDVVPAEGEPCFDIDLNTLKIGNGVDTYENLEPIGGVKLEVAADGKSIILEDGIFKLIGFDAAEVGAQPRKSESGSIEWAVPTVEADVTELKKDVAKMQDVLFPSVEGADTLLSRVESLEAQLNGSDEDSVDAKIDAKIEAFATSLTNDGKVNTLMELINYVESHGEEAADIAADISSLQELVGTTPVSEQIMTIVGKSEEKAKAVFEHVKYEISHKPEGTLVDYRDKEIRVMVPSDTQFEHQTSGANADANAYYIGFKAYAPEGAVSFKEDLAEIISDNTMYSFEGNDFAGIDAYGRKYSICWLAVAKYDEATQTWSTYGSQSTKDKYLGFYYSVEWYDANGVKIDSDCIRINLSNEACHNSIEPFYMAKAVKEVAVNGTVLDVVEGRVNIAIDNIIKSSDEIAVNTDGSLSIKSISFDKIVQDEETTIIMDGGGAV